jgi:hypothetical protein
MQKKLLISSGHLHRSEALYPENDLIKTEFYNDFLRPNDLFKGFGISMYNDHRFAFLSVIRSRRAGSPSEKELRLLSLLTPHLQRAIQLHEHLLPANGLGLSASILDRLGKGIIFVRRDLHVEHLNSAADQICAGLGRSHCGSQWISPNLGSASARETAGGCSIHSQHVRF